MTHVGLQGHRGEGTLNGASFTVVFQPNILLSGGLFVFHMVV